MRRTSRTLLGIAVAAVAALVAGTGQASAINSYNATPAPEGTQVGALVATWGDDGDPATAEQVDWVCSGTMVDANTFLTAAHCTAAFTWSPNVRFYVSLEQDVQAALDAAEAQHLGDPTAVARAVGVEGGAHTE